MSDHKYNEDFCKNDVHDFFGLTYASYLVVPRSVLQSMSPEWQHRFAELMDEATELYSGYDMDYRVNAVDERGRFKQDPLKNYERGRRYVTPRNMFEKIQDNIKGGGV